MVRQRRGIQSLAAAFTNRLTAARPGRCRATCRVTRLDRQYRSGRGLRSVRAISIRWCCPINSITISSAVTNTTTAVIKPTRPFRRKRSRSPCHPAQTLPGRTPAASSITTHHGQPDYLMTASTANTSDPDKQLDHHRHQSRQSALSDGCTRCATVFVLNPSVIYEAHADALPDGTHTDWSVPQNSPDHLGQALGYIPAAARGARWHGLDHHDQ